MKVAIIGAGFGGLAAAYDLRKAGHEVTILESADYVGGLASGFKANHWDWTVEKFYHHWFQSDKWVLGLIRELGWQDKVRFPRPYTVLLHKGKWYPFDSIPRALMFPGLGFGIDKLRFGFVGLFLRLTNNWKALERHTADAFRFEHLVEFFHSFIKSGPGIGPVLAEGVHQQLGGLLDDRFICGGKGCDFHLTL